MKRFLSVLVFTLAFAPQVFADPADLVPTTLKHAPPISKDVVLSNGFKPYGAFKGTGYIIEPLHANHAAMDFVAWHDESFDQLTVLFHNAWGGWPSKSMTVQDNADDIMAHHYNPFLTGDWFVYTVMNEDATKVIGSLYIWPGDCTGYDNAVVYWISTPARPDVEKIFVDETRAWIAKNFPYKATFYPGLEYSDQDRGQKYYEITRYICKP